MQELDEIDGMFKSGLENFKPDASHLSYSSLATAIGAKTAVSTTATAAKTGFFAKWGITMYVGLATVVTGTGVAIVYAPDHVAVETNSKAILAATTQLKEELQLLGKSPLNDSTFISGQEFSETSVEELTSSTQLLNDVKPINAKTTSFKTTEFISRKAFVVQKQETKQAENSDRSVKAIAKQESIAPSSVLIASKQLNAAPIRSAVVTKSIAELPFKNKQSVQVIALTPSLNTTDSLLASTEIPVERVEETIGGATDSSVNNMSRIITRPPFVWPQSKFSIKAGLGYVPLKTELVEDESDGITDSIPALAYYYYGDKVILRPTINNEFTTSFSYQKRLKNNLQLGVGVGYLQGGWDAFVDYSQEYWIDNGVGVLIYQNDTVRIGEYNFDYRNFSLNLYTGYDFVFNERLMVSTSVGFGLNQVFMTKDYRSYSSNAVTRINRSDFVVNGFGAADLTYRVKNLGFSIGATINGRTNLGKAIDGRDFHNSVSFGLNAGIHYFLTDKIR
ncbi:MAG: hypothetical protein HYZ43_11385 [Flavobacteriia bacterium]|nr:hypothetical protein [Flavobacteriia bacterium]